MNALIVAAMFGGFATGLGTRWFVEWALQASRRLLTNPSVAALVVVAILSFLVPLAIVYALGIGFPSSRRSLALCWLIGGGIGSILYERLRSKPTEANSQQDD